MSRLSPMTYREVIRALRQLGFLFDRQAKGSHEIWRNPQTRRYVLSPTLRAHHEPERCALLSAKQESLLRNLSGPVNKMESGNIHQDLKDVWKRQRFANFYTPYSGITTLTLMICFWWRQVARNGLGVLRKGQPSSACWNGCPGMTWPGCLGWKSLPGS